MILFHHRAALVITNRKSEIENGNWLPELDSHQHSRLQRALSYELDDPAMNWWSRRELHPHHVRLKAGCRSAVASTP